MVLRLKQISLMTAGVMLLIAAPALAVETSQKLAPPPSPAGIENDPGVLVDAAREAAGSAAIQQPAPELTREAQLEEMKEQTFQSIMTGMMPLSLDQIRVFMKRLEIVRAASVPPADGQPKGLIKVQAVSLDPGATPPQIDLFTGHITALNILDASGQPWPIGDIGVAGNFELKTTDRAEHVVRIIPLSHAAVGNLSIILKGLTTPVTFRLVSGGPTVHWRVDARLSKYGPNAKPPLIDRQRLSAGDGAIMLFLDNAPPPDAKKLRVAGIDSRTMAWQYQDKVYVRTTLGMLSPAWDASISSTDGTTVYQIGDAPVLLLSDAGAMVRVRLSRDGGDDR